MIRGELYKIKQQGRIAGVCAGLAEYFGIETWLVRILTVTAFLLMAPPFVFVAYIALWLILDDKSNIDISNRGASTRFTTKGDNSGDLGGAYSTSYNGKGYQNKVDSSCKVKSKVWQAGLPPRQAFSDVKKKYENIENKLRNLETYVTSKEFELNREISRL